MAREKKPPNRVDDLVAELQRTRRVGELERELLKLDRAGLSPAELESWLHLYGIAAFHAGQEAEALARFKEAYEKFPASADIRFSLGQQYLRTGSPEEGFKLFKTCRFPEISRDYTLMMARYAYLWSRYADGLEFIRPFYDAYKTVKILDDHFLYVRGLPFFGTWWGYLTAFAVLTGDFKEVHEVAQYVTRNCHDYDFERLQRELAAQMDDQPERLLAEYEERQREMPQGYFSMMVAVIKARSAADLATAEGLLSAAEVSEQELWLESVRNVALAEVAHRFNVPQIEADRAKTIVAQSHHLLLSPDTALDFHLLRYQERLKAAARATT